MRELEFSTKISCDDTKKYMALFHNGWVMIEAIAKKAYVFFYKKN